MRSPTLAGPRADTAVLLPLLPAPDRAVVECALAAAAERHGVLRVAPSGPDEGAAAAAAFRAVLAAVRAAAPTTAEVPVEILAHPPEGPEGLLVAAADTPDLDRLATRHDRLLVVPHAPHPGGAVVVGVTESTAEIVLDEAFRAAERAGSRLIAVRARGGGHAPHWAVARRRLDLAVTPFRRAHPGVRTRTVVTESGPMDALTSASTVARLVVVGTPSTTRGSALSVADLAGRLRCPLLLVAQDGPRRG
ncbi:hypothetical protein [Pseudonocardia xishanensis]|uniref:Universal stress protein family protein n=1 Tax=Pseudonocardia xishanensis TaxID=630995 RepID=A0ABP8RX72_9PSEU